MVNGGRVTLPLALMLAMVPDAGDRPPPPPPPIIDCFTPGPWIIFFEENGAALDFEDREVLDHLIARERGVCGGFSIAIAGHTDRGEHPSSARRRAKAVRTYLLRGFSSGNIAIEDIGSREPRIVHEGNVAELQNRRVEIRVLFRANGIISD